jgi:hypothetical protein
MARRTLRNHLETFLLAPAGRQGSLELHQGDRQPASFPEAKRQNRKTRGSSGQIVSGARCDRHSKASLSWQPGCLSLFAALQRCHDGRSTISAVDWEPYREILRPLPTQSCAVRAEQLVAEWWRDDLSPEKPWNDLTSWLSTIGNFSLAARLTRPDSVYFFYAIVSEHENRRRAKTLAAMRQKKYRRRMNHPIRRALTRLLGTSAKRTPADQS